MNKTINSTLKPKKESKDDHKPSKQPKRPKNQDEVSQIIQEKQKEKTNLINFRNDRNAVISLLAKAFEDHNIDSFIKTDSNGVKHLFIEGGEKELSDENLLHYVDLILKGTDTRYFTRENSIKYNKKLNKPINIQKESKKTIVEEHKEEIGIIEQRDKDLFEKELISNEPSDENKAFLYVTFESPEGSPAGILYFFESTLFQSLKRKSITFQNMENKLFDLCVKAKKNISTISVDDILDIICINFSIVSYYCYHGIKVTGRSKKITTFNYWSAMDLLAQYFDFRNGSINNKFSNNSHDNITYIGSTGDLFLATYVIKKPTPNNGFTVNVMAILSDILYQLKDSNFLPESLLTHVDKEKDLIDILWDHSNKWRFVNSTNKYQVFCAFVIFHMILIPRIYKATIFSRNGEKHKKLNIIWGEVAHWIAVNEDYITPGYKTQLIEIKE